MIFLTGITGFLGGFIARELVSHGFKIRALKRKSSDISNIADLVNKVEFFDGDLNDLTSLSEAMQGCDTVVHCAAIVSFNKADKDYLYRINVAATRDLVNLSLKTGISRFIYISSVAAIGDQLIQYQSDGHLIRKDSVSEYGKSKYLGELEVWRGEQEGLKVSVVNPSVILGPGDWSKGSPALFRYVWQRSSYYTEGNLNYVDVRDVAKSVRLILKGELSGKGYVLNAGTTTNRLLFEKIADLFQISPPQKSLNKKTGIFLAYVEKFRSVLFRTKPLITKEIIESSFSENQYNGTGFGKDFDFSYIPLEETVKWTVEELKNKYGLIVSRK